MSRYFFRPYGQDGYLSNFYKTDFEKDGNKYNCSEQAFMYAKCLMFDPTNSGLLREILNETNPGKIKKLGRSVKNFDDVKWNENKYKIMLECCRAKFNQNDKIKQMLCETNEEILYEASPYDKIWGIGYNKEKAEKISPDMYGENLLGKVLMEIREMIINEN